jgi:hypothetical protein
MPRAGRLPMWEGMLFALQIAALWILIHWLLTDEKAGGRAETGLLALRTGRRLAARPRRPGVKKAPPLHRGRDDRF